MAKHRTLSQKNEYYIPKEDYLTAIHYSRRYPLWLAEIQTAADTSKAIRYDMDKVQTSVGNGDTTANTAIRISALIDKVNTIEDTIRDVAMGMDYYLRLGVCYKLTFKELKGKGMPCERTTYYKIRQHYYYELSKKI